MITVGRMDSSTSFAQDYQNLRTERHVDLAVPHAPQQVRAVRIEILDQDTPPDVHGAAVLPHRVQHSGSARWLPQAAALLYPAEVHQGDAGSRIALVVVVGELGT